MRIERMDIPGTCFRVVFIPAGVSCPNHASLKSDGHIVEFYDRDHEFTPDGQFISRYYLDTLRSVTNGLDLLGCEPKWRLSPSAMSLVSTWLDWISEELR